MFRRLCEHHFHLTIRVGNQVQMSNPVTSHLFTIRVQSNTPVSPLHMSPLVPARVVLHPFDRSLILRVTNPVSSPPSPDPHIRAPNQVLAESTPPPSIKAQQPQHTPLANPPLSLRLTDRQIRRSNQVPSGNPAHLSIEAASNPIPSLHHVLPTRLVNLVSTLPFTARP